MQQSPLWQLVGWLVVFLTAVQFVPQVVRAYRTKELRGISLTTFVLIVITASTWIVHGVVRHDEVVVFANAFVLISAIAIVILKLKYKNS
jgi:MtN3 and saliva related transmembrane protein